MNKNNPFIIKQNILDFFAFDDDTLKSGDRHFPIPLCKQVMSYMMYHHTNITTIKIAELTYRKEHSSALYDIRAVSNRMEVDIHFRNIIKKIELYLKIEK